MILFRTASLHLPYDSRTPTSVPLVVQGWAQAASLWAFCLLVHRVGSSIGVVGSPPRQLGYLDGLDKSLLPEHAHRKMNKNHMCCDWQGGLPVQSKSSVISHQWRTIGSDLESLQHQLREILI